ncbi:hypothetical protein DSO57_1036442 [Entomophthora muscae]|uniref:Uncharacterized protein n=1 Tax=Entomophthora muscae TaxID=34485 RepID=A0ACC2SZL9_9FUNG|nr:hypothetical protein DSO57_1036442 [Entomophthora muscae]
MGTYSTFTTKVGIIVFNVNITPYAPHREEYQGRKLTVFLRFKEKILPDNVVFYAPCQRKDNKKFFETMEDEADDRLKIVASDNNAATDRLLDRKYMKIIHFPTTQPFLSSMFAQGLQDLILEGTQTFLDHSFHNGHSSSRIDHFHGSTGILRSCIRPQVLKLTQSDHSLLWFQVKTRTLPSIPMFIPIS